MDVLIVDDETGIREGLASLLRLRGHRVRTAGTVVNGLAELEGTRFDVVVTDWRLPDGDADAIVARTAGPCIVVSGHPDDIAIERSDVRVLGKPVHPDALIALVDACAARPAPCDEAPCARATLPADTAARVEFVRSLCADVEVRDDGSHVTVLIPRPSFADLELIALCGGDLREVGGAPPRCELRLWRDGRPADVAATSTPDGAWPAPPERVAVDLDAHPCAPHAFLRLLDRAAAARRRGQAVDLINLPAHLRLFVEALGRSAELPKRPMSGPRIPVVLAELWSQS